MKIETFFDADTATATYVVSDSDGKAAVIDSVLDYEPTLGKISTQSADRVIEYVRANGLSVEWLLETHVHADHLSAAWYLKSQIGGRIAIGEHIRDVLGYWVPVFDAAADTPQDGTQFDHLFADNEEFSIGGLRARVLHTPGHTPACVSYLIGDAIFVGDTIFMPYVGTARTDFPGGDAATLYRSIRERILSLPPETRIFTGHDYPPEGSPAAWQSTVGEQRKSNALIRDGVGEAEFVELRNGRDRGKAAPRLILPSVQVNLRAGRLPSRNENGRRYVRIPLRGEWTDNNASGAEALRDQASAAL